MFLALQVRLVLLHVLGGFVAPCEHAKRDLDIGCFRRIDHGGVAFGPCTEGRGGSGGRERDDLPAPAETDDAPGLDARVLGLHLSDEREDFLSYFGRRMFPDPRSLRRRIDCEISS